MTIGVVGLGYVGTALFEGFNNAVKTLTYDRFKDSTEDSLKSLVEKVDIIFVSVPTPMRKDGSCDLSIVDGVLSEINDCSKKDLITVIKSTVRLGSINLFEKEYSNLTLVFNPEFLTEANFINDFKNQNFIILGSNNKNISQLEKLYSSVFPNAKILNSKSSEAELTKYFINSFLAVKVSFANEIYSLCKKMEINYDKVVELASNDPRIGNSHLNVPGQDGKFGYGGSCFPKDINSLIDIFSDNKIESYILTSSWARNKNLDRTESDWEELKGRAVSEEHED
jgi:nucleotide sugar dehydrogenase